MSTTFDFLSNIAKVLTVAELTRSIRSLLESRFGAVWVQGEISNYKKLPSGHQYFTLKDQRAQIACVIFRDTLPPFPKPLTDGLQVQVYGRVSVFEARGQYQLSVEILQPRGQGLLQAKFEALKRKLDAEGLFDSARKRPLPKHPRRIGIVTSPSGAAIRDILNVLQRRARGVEILINPVRVQGSGAAAEIATAIRELSEPNENWQPLDLIVVTRGGGSIEDLWEFNEEIVARAIFQSAIPVVSAVGHEIDFTIADFVADLRAPTPSAAAELIVPDVEDLSRRIVERNNCLRRCVQNSLAEAQQRLGVSPERMISRELSNRLRESQQSVDLSREVLTRALNLRLTNHRHHLEHIFLDLKMHRPSREIAVRREKFSALWQRIARTPPGLTEQLRRRLRDTENLLRVLGPAATLQRGYSITTTTKGAVIRKIGEVRPRLKLRTRVSDGEFESTVG
jgi:exodeoxyribonuclease VII large subunit